MEDSVAETDVETVAKDMTKKTPSLEEEIKAVGFLHHVMVAPPVGTEKTVAVHSSTLHSRLWRLQNRHKVTLFSRHCNAMVYSV